ncbi:unnamed protein product [Cuscuta epithymum]|uniref:Uncharacterized protein n=1 Tax=Cuscuta epithymum TaxID=186058 RepID=A0AAV0CVF5_9ASTE|nr:unnamed protein product [Cuscuta epithymum]
MATTVLCSMIGQSAPSYPAHVQLVHPFQGGDERLMHHDRPLSAIVSRLTVRLAHSLQDGDDRLMQYDRPLSAIVSRLTVRLAHSLQDGDDRLMQYDRPLSAIVPSSRSARPSLPGWRRTSYASRSAPSAPSCPDSRFGSPIPSRMATTVLCSTIGPSAPSYLAHVRLVHPFQGGDERLMHHDRPLSAIMSRFTVRLAHSLQDGDDRLMQYDRPLSAIVPSSRSARPSLPGSRRTSRMQHDQRLCAIVSGSCSARPSLSGLRRTSLMQHNRPRRAIVSGSSPDFPSLLGWRRPSYAARLPLGADMPGLSMRATAFYHISHSFSHTLHPYITCIHAFMHHTSYIHTYTRASCFDIPRRRFIDAWTSKLLRLESSSQSALLLPDAFRRSVPVEEHPSPDPVGKGGASLVDYVQECRHSLIYYDYVKTQFPARQRKSAGRVYFLEQIRELTTQETGGLVLGYIILTYYCSGVQGFT